MCSAGWMRKEQNREKKDKKKKNNNKQTKNPEKTFSSSYESIAG